MLDLLLADGLPRPRVNARLVGLPRCVEVDFPFAEAGLVVEADGARYHENRLARDADVARQAMLEAARYRVLRVNWDQVTGGPTRRSAGCVRRSRTDPPTPYSALSAAARSRRVTATIGAIALNATRATVTPVPSAAAPSATPQSSWKP